MLNIKNNNLRFRKGDTVNISLDIKDINGVPYILPVFDDTRYIKITDAEYIDGKLKVMFGVYMPVDSQIEVIWSLPTEVVEYQDNYTLTCSLASGKEHVLNKYWELYVGTNKYIVLTGLIVKANGEVLFDNNYNRVLVDEKVNNAYICMTIRDGIEGNVVYENYLDMNHSSAWFKKHDIDEVRIQPAGYTVFTSQVIQKFDEGLPLGYLQEHPTEVAYSKQYNMYYCVVPGKNIDHETVVYDFNIGFQISPEDTAKLDLQNYIYDINLYIGKDKFVSDGFPLETIAYKQTLVPVSEIILEDSTNNG